MTKKKKIGLGKIGKTRGLKGELRIQIYNPDSELFDVGAVVHADESTGFTNLTIASRNREWLTFREILNPEDARKLTNQEVFLYRDEMPELPPGNYYQVDMIGCQIIDHETRDPIGVLKNIVYTVSNDIWVVEQKDGPEIMIPIIPDVMGKIDLDQQQISIHMPEEI